ncbi:hypothetical protein EXN66_Car007168 [Channa argus]|uniref:Uncharacterized protein n=1 Tax=Channa argus TaxID=215402 RepID=A0A6G1PMU5_CHAAH|nr:hypothetical protein EXN66_Car007168 [Channa argus]
MQLGTGKWRVRTPYQVLSSKSRGLASQGGTWQATCQPFKWDSRGCVNTFPT